jgi:FixJ family two-component response regulator
MTSDAQVAGGGAGGSLETGVTPIIYIVDDEPFVRSYLSRLLTSNGHRVSVFGSADELLEIEFGATPGCVLLDLFLPGLGGLEVQRILAERAAHLPIIFMSGRGTVPLSVEAMKNGAMDFFTKPIDTQKLLQAVTRAVRMSSESVVSRAEDAVIEARIRSLSPRQVEVIRLVSLGRLNKQIANELEILEKTVKVHRARAMRKLGVKSVAELVRLADHIHLSVKRP